MTDFEDVPESIRVFLRGSESLRDNLLSTTQHGTKLARGIVEIVAEQFPGYSLEVTFERCQGSVSFSRALRESPDETKTAIRAFAPDLVVTSVDADLLASTESWGNELIRAFESNMLDVIRIIKRDIDSRVIVLNASSVVPNESVSNYRNVDRRPHSFEAHRLNLAAIRLSFEEGISIVDVDRVIAELGAAGHVFGFLDYSAESCEAICSEFVRVVEDYGFFDSRPLLPQVGRGTANRSR